MGHGADHASSPTPLLRRLVSADTQKPLPHELRPRLHNHRHGGHSRRSTNRPTDQPANSPTSRPSYGSPMPGETQRRGAEGGGGAAGRPLPRELPSRWRFPWVGFSASARFVLPSLPSPPCLPAAPSRAPPGSRSAAAAATSLTQTHGREGKAKGAGEPLTPSEPRCGPDHSAHTAHCHGDRHNAPSPSARHKRAGREVGKEREGREGEERETAATARERVRQRSLRESVEARAAAERANSGGA